jgi:NADPH:quinone reductase-like Zn-dependent oxidoreductase
MKAIRFDDHGDPVKVLAIEQRPVPEPGDGEVRVRILASPINPSYLLYVRDTMRASRRSFGERRRRFVLVRVPTRPPNFSRSSALLQTRCKR